MITFVVVLFKNLVAEEVDTRKQWSLTVLPDRCARSLGGIILRVVKQEAMKYASLVCSSAALPHHRATVTIWTRDKMTTCEH